MSPDWNPHLLTDAEFRDLIERARSPIIQASRDRVRDDNRRLAEHANVVHGELIRMTAELRGAMQTMLALCRAVGGTIEIPFPLIDDLDGRDKMHIEDRQLESGLLVKRFTYRPHTH